jgi:predicted DNA-binding transcriptional regulator YafY
MNKKNNKISQRNIKVLKMQDDEIEAYCYLRHQVRHFKKENILAADYKH